MFGCRHGMLTLWLLLAPAMAQAQTVDATPSSEQGQPALAPAPAAPGEVIRLEAAPSAVRIFSAPPMRWDSAMTAGTSAVHQGRSDFSNLTSGVTFGMLSDEVNALLPTPYPVMGWGVMPQATEYPGDVRYFWVGFASAGPLRMATKHCAGAGSYLVLLFTNKGLFRLSYRLVPDAACPSVNEAARDVFARYVTIGSEVALTIRYHTGSADVVDVTDPGASFLIPVRWYQVGR